MDGAAVGGSVNGGGSVCSFGHGTVVEARTAVRGSAAPAQVSASAAAKQPAKKRLRVLVGFMGLLLFDSE